MSIKAKVYLKKQSNGQRQGQKLLIIPQKETREKKTVAWVGMEPT